MICPKVFLLLEDMWDLYKIYILYKIYRFIDFTFPMSTIIFVANE